MVDRYHHGDLRRALIDAALAVIAEAGTSALSLRDLARRSGVSHAAPAHHFGDKAGLLTAIAAEGYHLQAAALRTAYARRHNFLDVGIAYVRFALDHRAHFEVMYRPDLYHSDDEDLRLARESSSELLYGPLDTLGEDRTSAIAAWSLVHGLATLWLNGNLPAHLGSDPEALTRAVAGVLFRDRRNST